MHRSPETASVQMRSSTELSDGSMNGVNAPLRASPSQATTSATIGEHAREAPQQRARAATARAPPARRAAADHCVCSRHRSIRCMSI